MDNEKDRYGEKMRLLERAREDIFFAEKDKELIEKLKARLKRVESSEKGAKELKCLKCSGEIETYAFMGFILDRCRSCGGIWLDKGELEGILRKLSRSPLAWLVDRLLARGEEAAEEKRAGR